MQLELMARQVSWLEHMNRIQLLSHVITSSKLKIKTNVPTDESNSRNET